MIDPRAEENLPMVTFFRRLIEDEPGGTAIEYGLIAALIVIGSLVAVNSTSLSLNLSKTFGTAAAKL
jgi:pilus assembly protein Flp/PilA